MSAVTGAVAAAIGAAVGSSVAGSVGGSAGGSSASSSSSGGGGGDSGPPADPLALLFLVQALAMTSKLSCMTEAYANFAGGFSMFNLVMSPPGPLKNFWALEAWFPWWFHDDTHASHTFSGHLFWCASSFAATVCVHLFQLGLLRCLDFPVPGFLAWPQMEIVGVLVLSMGILDVSFGVLATLNTAWGWKILATIEIILVLLFIRWFVNRGKDFMRRTKWVPNLNVAQMKMFQNLDANGDGVLSLEEMKEGHKALGLVSD